MPFTSHGCSSSKEVMTSAGHLAQAWRTTQEELSTPCCCHLYIKAISRDWADLSALSDPKGQLSSCGVGQAAPSRAAPPLWPVGRRCTQLAPPSGHKPHCSLSKWTAVANDREKHEVDTRGPHQSRTQFPGLSGTYFFLR